MVDAKRQLAGAGTEAAGPAINEPQSANGPRLPYRPPQLRHLGSVRDLTWGSGGQIADDVDPSTNHPG